MNLNEVDKLFEFRNFNDIKKYLSEHNVPVIPHYIDDKKDCVFEKKFDLIVKDIFKINDKNKIHNIKNFIIGFEPLSQKKDSFTIYKLYSNDYDSIPSIIINYINPFKYREMMEPLSLLFSNKPSSDYLRFSFEDKYKLNVYQIESGNHVYEILEPCEALQNPIYGLLHYVHLNQHPFDYKSFFVNDYNTYKLEESIFSIYIDFFKSIELENYEYELINNEKNKDMFYLNFYKTEDKSNADKNRMPLITLYLKNTFYRNFIIESKILEKLLDIIKETEQYITVRHYSDEIITLKIGKSEYKIENNYYVFLQDIFQDLALEQKHIIKRIYYFFRELFVNYTKDGVITTNNYYDGYHSNNRSMISSKFRSNLLS